MTDATTGALVAAYDYSPYGNITRTWGTANTDYRYAGLFYHPTSGLNLATYRAYDGLTGRFINRDPIRERGGVNLYGYVGANPVKWVDAWGLQGTPPVTPVPPSNIHGGPWRPAPGQPPGTFWGDKVPGGGSMQLRWVPPEGQGGPPGSIGYWKTKTPTQEGWDRFNCEGKPITPEEAHPNPLPSVPPTRIPAFPPIFIIPCLVPGFCTPLNQASIPPSFSIASSSVE